MQQLPIQHLFSLSSLQNQFRVRWQWAPFSSVSLISLEVHVASFWPMRDNGMSPKWAFWENYYCPPQNGLHLAHAFSLLSVSILAAWKAQGHHQVELPSCRREDQRPMSRRAKRKEDPRPPMAHSGSYPSPGSPASKRFSHCA